MSRYKSIQNLKWKTKVFLLSMLVALPISSCGENDFDSKKEMLAYLADEENGFIKTKTVKGIDYSLMYRPTDLMVQHELSENPGDIEIAKFREKYKDYLYFNLSLGKGDREILTHSLKDKSKYRQLLHQLSFNMKNRITVSTQKRDTVPVIDCIYPRMYDLDGKNMVLFLVSKTDKILQTEFLNIVISDMGLSTGEVAFKFPVDLIKKEPKLKF
ncbi:hypothetical protein [Flagellimonas sp. S3867]|uniref:hypothetical protein n=1 Tax=Flagellimonas sp. S3867 TaxID=2768063 RepID=UPI0016864ACE|nr:hypothetical protein [Flagellimonas sp. S3867]